jgi:hypothetical protein
MKSLIGLSKCLALMALCQFAAQEVTWADDTAPIQRLSLGLTLDGQSGDRAFGVYIPTRFGGELTVATTDKDAKLGPIVGPDGREHANGADLGTNAHGWYTFAVKGSQGEYSV